MTIATHNGHLPAPAEGTLAGAPQPQASALMLFVQEARQANVIAESLARTSFVPASLRGKPDDITAAILAGQELGLQPMATLRSIDVIQGTPGLRAHAMRGLVQSRGHSVQVVESTPDRCVMRGRRAGEQEWQQVEWTIARATQMGLTGKDQWKKQPQTMLVARATGEICRLIASDVLYAMPYAAEELDGMPSAPSADGQARVTVEEILSSRSAPTEAGAPPVEAPAEKPRMITEPQQKKLGALMREHGITDRDTALGFVTEVIGREVTSRAELTLVEAGKVIDTLESMTAPTDEVFDGDIVDDAPGEAS
ncbi:hypothetical protein [Streptosporangium saharense]|uniref:hypothetical protein n=1 Tax=Streptosporangium saharense TaxID=1706840 RepID=UPI0034329ABD